MKNYIKIYWFLCIGIFFGTISLYANQNSLVSPSWLQANLDRVQVLDIRNEITEGFLPGSLHAPYRIWRSTDPQNPGRIPDLDVLKANIESLGLSLEGSQKKPIVIVFAGKNSTDFGSAARVYWTLKYLGFENLSILNGGLNAYRELPDASWVDKADNASSLGSKNQPFIPRLKTEYLVGNEEVTEAVPKTSFWDTISGYFRGDKEASHVDEGSAYLIDSRSDAQYQGKAKHPAAVRYGAIAGSHQVWQGEWFVDESATLKSPQDLKVVADSYRIPDDREIFVYCNTGHWAASNWFVISELLGYPNVKLYPDSFVKYSQLDDIQLIHEPSRLAQLWEEVKNWF